MQENSKSTNESLDPIVLKEAEITHNVSECMSEDLDKLSPLDIDFQGQRFSSSDVASTDSHLQVKALTQGTSGSISPSSVDKSYTLRHDDGTVSDKRYTESERGSWINIQLVGRSEFSVDSDTLTVPVLGDTSHMGGSLDRVSMSSLVC